MARLPFALALLGLLFASTACGAPSTEAVVSKPSLVCPQAKLGDEDLQAQYEKVWKQFTAEVDLATKALDSEIATRFTEAQTAGNLNLALMWDGMKKQFNQLSELRWDSAKEKKAWKQRFGEADFPDELTALLKRCDQDYKSARERLEEGYKNIESALTKAGKLEQALKVRAERNAVLAGESAPQPVPPTKREEKAPPVVKKSLKDRLVGKWNRSNSDLYWIIMVDGTAGARRKADNAPAHADSRARIISEDVAEITWPGGLIWRMREAGDNMLAVEEITPSGNLLGDGLVISRAK